MFIILRNVQFRLAWLSYTASGAATSITPVALTLYLLDTHGGIEVLGLVLGARTAGFVLGAILGVGIIDGYSRRNVLTLSSAIRGMAILASIVTFSFSVPLLCATILVAGLGEGIFRGAYQALIGEVVAEKERQQANALSTLSNRVLLVGSPTLAAILYASIGGSATLLATGLLWLGSAWLAKLLPNSRRVATTGSGKNPFSDFGGVLSEVARHRWFIAGLGALVVWLTLGFAVQQLTLPLISRDLLGVNGNTFLGVALGSYSLGAAAAAVWMAKWTPRRPGRVAFIGLSLYGLVPLALTIPAISPQWGIILVLLAYFLGGAGIEAFNIPWFSAVQREVAPDKLGRVFSFDFMVSYAIAPLGLILLPYALTAAGQTPVLLICGLMTVGVSLIVLVVPGALELADPLVKRGHDQYNSAINRKGQKPGGGETVDSC